MATTSNHLSKNLPDAWPSLLSTSLATLRRLAGASEHDFLQIGSQMQSVYQRSCTLAETAHRLVEVASGDRIRTLMRRLSQMLQEMEAYLEQAQGRNLDKCATLERVGTLLQQVVEPLEGFKRMSKHLYILEVSIKIESTYLGEMEGEFLNLAQDIKKLSLQIREKTNAVQDHRVLLSAVITKNIADIHAANASQGADVRVTINDTVASLAGLEAVNERFSLLGKEVFAVSEENANNISGIVQSLQIHDMYRQQVEHVVEALDGYVSSLAEASDPSHAADACLHQECITKAGDVCELQEAQLQFASTELYTAVASIVSHLRDISRQQRQMGQGLYAHNGAVNASSTSFVDDVRQHMASITDLLTACADTNNELAEVTGKVIGTVEKITHFVADIEDIGHEIIQIALNSRIKAACTDANGAALSVLSKEIGELSSAAVQRADTITATLTEIHSAITVLSTEASSDEQTLSRQLSGMKEDLGEALILLENMGAELLFLLPQIQGQIQSLTAEIEDVASHIDVHERTQTLAETVLASLKQVCSESRALYPASAAFKEDLRGVATRYTMESERRIHENIAGKQGGNASLPQSSVSTSLPSDESEFGDNVDLF